MSNASWLIRMSVAAGIVAGLQSLAKAAVFSVATNPAIQEIAGGVVPIGTNYLVGLVSGTNIVGQRISGSGNPEGAAVVIGSNPGFPPAVTLAGATTNVLIAWSDRSINSGVSAFGRIYSPQDGQIGPVFPLLSSAAGHGFQEVKAAASDGSNFLVLWEDTSTATWYAQGVGGTGVLTGSKTALFSTGYDATIRFGNTDYLVAWQAKDAFGSTHTYCRTISPTGVLGNPTQISVTGSYDHNPIAIGFDGANFFVVWNCTSGDKELAIYGRFVSQAGVLIGNELVLIPERAVFPAMAFDGANYLIVWSHELPSPEHNLRARFFNTHGNPAGPVFSPWPINTGSAPLFALNGLICDSTGFVLVSTHGDFTVDENGDIIGIEGADVFGTFPPKSTTPPVLANVRVKSGLLEGQVKVVPGVTYTIELSTNLPVWMPAALLSSDGTNVLTLVDEEPCANEPQLFYRAVMGNRVPPRFDLSFIQFASGGQFGTGYSPEVHLPVEVNSYCAMLKVETDSDFPDPQNVLFTGPAGSSLLNAPAVPASSSVGTGWAQYQSPTIHTASGVPGGTWVVNYKGENITIDVPDPQTRFHTVVPLPSVMINNGLIQSVNWVYKDAASGTTLPNPPSWLLNVQLQLDSGLGTRIYNSSVLAPNVTSHVLSVPINWSEVGNLYMAYEDSLRNHYVLVFSKH